MVVAIDGPAGAGKSTVARAVAAELGFTFLDSGAMYRCVALARLRDAAVDPAALAISLTDDAVYLDAEDVTDAIRTPEVSELASVTAADPLVREAMVARQQDLLADGDWVAEGRDIGTVVCPAAEVKVFLTADPAERARRRAAQSGLDVAEVERQQAERDERDRTREHSPLVAAADAVELDTTGLSADEVIAEIVRRTQAAR
jgi:cytidylate kinase